MNCARPVWTHPSWVLIQPNEDAFGPALEHDIRLTISSVRAGERMGEIARRTNKVAPVHCAIDTGMGRQGFSLDSALDDLHHLTRVSHIDIEGISTHFAMSDVRDDPFTGVQMKRFKSLLRQIEKSGIPFEMLHAANSGAIVAHPDTAFDMVRPGIMAFGAWPMGSRPALCPLKPVLRWETRIALLKDLPQDWSIGYGRTYSTQAPMRTAVLPVGYRDGYRRELSNRSDVLIRGRRCPVRGRVSMDQIVVDVTGVPSASVGDPAVLIGSDGSETISVEELAQLAETIPNDILTGIGPRVRRVHSE